MGIGAYLKGIGSAIAGKSQQRPRRLKRAYYNAAALNRLTNDWSTAQSSPKQELRASLRILRARSRDLARNNDYAKRFINLCKTNVVGHTGVAMQSKVKDTNGNFDIYANRQIEQAWAKWGKKGNCELTGRLSWVDCQKLAVESLARDGEVILRRYTGRKFGPHKYQVKFIDPDLLDEEYNQKFTDGREISMGIETDSLGRVTHYHIYTKHPSDSYSDRTRERVPANQICHWFITERIDQNRGVPQMVSTMHRLHMLGGYEEAELVASRGGAAKMGFIYEDGDPGEYAGDEEEDTGATIQDLEPGTIERLSGSQRFVPFDPQHPTSAFKDFVKALLRGISSGLNVSYVDLASDLEGVSYSSIRKGELADRDSWRVLQTSLTEHICTWVFEGWLQCALSPQITGLPISKIDKFNAPFWQPRGWAWVDPQKEVNANKEAVRAGFKSITRVILEQGGDPEEVFAELAKDKERAEAIGLSLDIFEQSVLQTFVDNDDDEK